MTAASTSDRQKLNCSFTFRLFIQAALSLVALLGSPTSREPLTIVVIPAAISGSYQHGAIRRHDCVDGRSYLCGAERPEFIYLP